MARLLIVLLLALNTFALLNAEAFLDCGPLCDDGYYLECHDRARSGYLSCTAPNEVCKCYYVGALVSQCTKFCPAYNKNTYELLSSLCSRNVYEMSNTKIVETSAALNVLKTNETRKSALSARPWPSESDWERDVLELKLSPKIRSRQRLLPESHEVLQAIQRNYTVHTLNAAPVLRPTMGHFLPLMALILTR